LKKLETDQNYEETDLKFEETDQQSEILKVFVKSGNGSKLWGNRPTNIWGNWSKKRGNHSTLNIGKRIQNIWKSLNNSELLRDFDEILKNNKNSCKIIFDPFPCH